tara:strand:- start:95 stop:445 length:351 start_codon:yes stop_codon:yes gene_type:complete
MSEIMKKCCGLCPYSRKDTLYLHPSRAEEFAAHAENPYNDFVCHKTGVVHEDHPNEDRQSEIVRGEKSMTCCGFASMQHYINDNPLEEGFTPDPDAFDDSWEMTEHHTEYFENKNN